MDKLLKKFQENLNTSTRYIPLFDNRYFALKKLIIFCEGIQINPTFWEAVKYKQTLSIRIIIRKKALFTKMVYLLRC